VSNNKTGKSTTSRKDAPRTEKRRGQAGTRKNAKKNKNIG